MFASLRKLIAAALVLGASSLAQAQSTASLRLEFMSPQTLTAPDVSVTFRQGASVGFNYNLVENVPTSLGLLEYTGSSTVRPFNNAVATAFSLQPNVAFNISGIGSLVAPIPLSGTAISYVFPGQGQPDVRFDFDASVAQLDLDANRYIEIATRPSTSNDLRTGGGFIGANLTLRTRGNSIPEPSALVLLGLSGLGLSILRRRRAR